MNDPVTALLGIKVYHLLAGLAGGMVRAIIRPGGSTWSGVGTCIVGALTAAYWTPITAPWLSAYLESEANSSIEGATGFAIGVSGMAVAEGILRVAQNFRKP